MSVTEHRDRGATAIFLAFVLVLLIGAAAIAVDLALAWNERRQDVTSIDVGAVAGALQFGQDTTASIADEVMDTARFNLDTTYTDSEWSDLWTACDGSSRPQGFVAATSSIGTIECIGLNPSFLWAKLPDQLTDTSFGRVLGFDSLTTNAEVIVTLIGDGGAGALPFAIRNGETPGHICMKTKPGTPEPPCDGPETGSFGNIAPSLFGNEHLNTPQWCPNNPDNQSFHNVALAIAMGIDHFIFPFPAGAWGSGWQSSGEKRADLCNETSGFVAEPREGAPINTVIVGNGNGVQNDLTEGLITGGPYPDEDGRARLLRSPNTRSIELRNNPYQVDNKALWEYLIGNSVEGCAPSDFEDILDNEEYEDMEEIEAKTVQMHTCLDNYWTSGSGDQLFSDTILENPRLGLAPRFWHSNLPPGNSEQRPIQKFELVFIHALLISGNSDAILYPDDDEVISINGNPKVDQVSAYLLADSMVSDTVHLELGGLTNDTWQPTIWR